jgi:hypothetical protein
MSKLKRLQSRLFWSLSSLFIKISGFSALYVDGHAGTRMTNTPSTNLTSKVAQGSRCVPVRAPAIVGAVGLEKRTS